MAEALEIFGFCLNEDNVKKGVLEAKWPGRFEKIKEGPLLIIDSAHTVESARCCVKTFEKIFPHKKYILLF
jgi:dihydrofolate synthase/folylpolyglutamate synthase